MQNFMKLLSVGDVETTDYSVARKYLYNHEIALKAHNVALKRKLTQMKMDKKQHCKQDPMQDYGSFFRNNSLIVETPQLCAGKVRLEAPDKRRVHFLQEKLMHASINAKVE